MKERHDSQQLEQQQTQAASPSNLRGSSRRAKPVSSSFMNCGAQRRWGRRGARQAQDTPAAKAEAASLQVQVKQLMATREAAVKREAYVEEQLRGSEERATG